jgi:hypothetical protein
MLALLLGASLAAAPGPRAVHTAGATYLCTPQQALRHARRCPTQGPGARLVDFARRGLYPPQPLPIAKADPSLSYLPFQYLKVDGDGIPIYPSLQAAQTRSGSHRTLPPGFLFLTYEDTIVTESGETFYQVDAGEYIRADRVSRITPPRLQGFAFSRTPSRPFGWVISGTYTRTAPGEGAPFSEHWLGRWAVVQVYQSLEVDGLTWYMVGPDEWVEQRLLALVFPDPQKPEGVEGERWISINLYEQTVAAYEKGELVYAALASTGRQGAWTQPGTFQVWAKLERDDMTGGLAEFDSFYFLEDVPWVLYFDKARALHGTYWHTQFGYPTSRGCVNLSPADARWFFQFAQEGTWVHVFDPSGKTPTDPALYGAGGA